MAASAVVRSLLAVACSASLACGPIVINTGGPSSDGGNSDSSGSQQQGSGAAEACKQSCHNGCCTQQGECVAGTSGSACGAAGNVCQECAMNQRCEQSAAGGQCRACSQLNCNGCCTLDGTCMAGTMDDACGSAGETCVACGSGFCAPYGTGGGRCQ